MYAVPTVILYSLYYTVNYSLLYYAILHDTYRIPTTLYYTISHHSTTTLNTHSLRTASSSSQHFSSPFAVTLHTTGALFAMHTPCLTRHMSLHVSMTPWHAQRQWPAHAAHFVRQVWRRCSQLTWHCA